MSLKVLWFLMKVDKHKNDFRRSSEITMHSLFANILIEIWIAEQQFWMSIVSLLRCENARRPRTHTRVLPCGCKLLSGYRINLFAIFNSIVSNGISQFNKWWNWIGSSFAPFIFAADVLSALCTLFAFGFMNCALALVHWKCIIAFSDKTHFPRWIPTRHASDIKQKRFVCCRCGIACYCRRNQCALNLHHATKLMHDAKLTLFHWFVLKIAIKISWIRKIENNIDFWKWLKLAGVWNLNHLPKKIASHTAFTLFIICLYFVRWMYAW